MFYSQFILAKKGPLGTIWIAAHLERKLRKNQVADTDIGVSVDSILFPDVPIALRLSSHLLLGVVRIYSRKVNYLFDDCSEALLKIKQAFRSTAVDLPPEESTAPYHSITLPETFDLDDFELPDSDVFQGNYVDHHISSREQITLQDTMEGVVYSTSQFGPDERFGDGDASGLDLDEELFLDNVAAAGEAGLILGSDAGLQASVRSMTPVKQAENHVANSETMLASGDIEGGDEDTDFAEYAQAPCTPGLMEEPNLSTVQETSACDDHMETENHNSAEFSVKESHLENACNSKSDLQHENQNMVDSDDLESSCQLKQPSNDTNTVPPHMPAGDNNDDLEYSQRQQLGKLPSELSSDKIIAAASDDGPEGAEVLVNGTTVGNERSGRTNEEPEEGIIMLGESTLPDMSTTSTGTYQPPVSEVPLENSNQEEPPATIQIVSNKNVEIAGTKSNRESDDGFGNESKDSEKIMKSFSDDVHVLLPCTTTACLNLPDHPLNPGGDGHLDLPLEEESAGLCSKDSSAFQGEVAADISKQVLLENHNTRPSDSCEGIQERSISRSNDQVDQVIGDDFQLAKDLDSSTRSDFPAPEKLLSVPEGHGDVENNNFLVEEVTPDKEETVMEFDRAGAVSESVSGKKRSFTESSLTVQSLYSAESFGVPHTKGTVESIPDDNDLLSSILVGRKSSVLKVKPTPTETTSMKRPRSAPRTSTSKRKVLMDDSMVLHGDTIRQQLTNTEDIRRVRKKAPCTRLEISMIQKQFWEDEIFSEPVLTGVSTELASLHNQTYDLSEIRVSQCDVNDASFEVAADPKLISPSEEEFAKEAVNDDTGGMSFGLDVAKEIGIVDGSSDPMIVRDEEAQVQFADDILVRTENQQCEDQSLSSEMYATTQVQMNITNGEGGPKISSQHEHLGESAEMENNGICVSDATFAVELGASVDRNGEAGAFLHIDEPAVLPDQISDMVEIEASMMDTNSLLKGIDANDIAAVDKFFDNEAAGGQNDDENIGGVDKFDANESEGKNGDEIAATVETESNRAKDEFLLEETEFRSDIQPVVNPSASPEMVTIDHQAIEEEIRKNDQEVTLNEYASILDAQVEYNNEKGYAVSNGIYGGEQDSLNTAAELNTDLRNAFSDDGRREEAYPPFMIEEGEVSATDLLQHHHDDLDYSTAEHDTEFLNVDDDDEEAELDGDSMPSAEETRFFENSGWSSRTRAVANYLQTLFEKEAERGRKVLPIDNLLAGKTRKEASRMFFEALVLKTKDYVHVEQKTPFDNINIFPRLKLLKSDF